MGYDRPINFGVAGIGGYGATICDGILRAASDPQARARLAAVWDRNPGLNAEQVNRLRSAGVQIAASFEQLLKSPIEVIWLPLPIDLHRPFTEAALGAGKAVICEKPAAGSVQDVDAMIAARDRTKRLCLIGYQDLYQPAVHELKRRLLRGEFGAVLSATVLACWPRGQSYYRRNDWAGRISREGRWILDSPACNAMAHYLHLALFLLGTSELQCAQPTEVEAELYRANPIENFDTCNFV